MTTTTIDTAQLRALAEKATQGRREWVQRATWHEMHVYGDSIYHTPLIDNCLEGFVNVFHSFRHDSADAKFLAATDPATVLTLLDRSDRLDAIREAVEHGRWDEVARLAKGE